MAAVVNTVVMNRQLNAIAECQFLKQSAPGSQLSEFHDNSTSLINVCL
jgi:hypothetical protein